MRRRALLLASFAVLVPLKLAWIAGDEIVAQRGDAFVYAAMTRNLAVGAGAPLGTYRPGFPAVAATLMLAGVPYRLGLELAYLGASLLLAVALWRASGFAALGVFSGWAVALHPWSFDQFRYFLSEPPLLCSALICLCAVLWWDGGARGRGRWWIAGWAGTALAAWDLMRNETVLTVATYVSWVAWLLFRHRLRWPWREGLALALPLAMLAAVHLGARAVNSIASGTYTVSALEMPGYLALMKALHRIDTGEAGVDRPFSRASLVLACAASPTLARRCDEMLAYSDREAPGGELPGGVGWGLNFVVFNAAAEGTLAQRDRAMGRVAAEIEAALERGELRARGGVFPFGPDWQRWAPRLPQAIFARVRAMGSIPGWSPLHDFATEYAGRITAADRLLFDAVASRRTHLTAPAVVAVTGVIAGAAGDDVSVSIEEGEGGEVARARLRPDGEVLRFDLKATLKTAGEPRLVVEDQSGRRASYGIGGGAARAQPLARGEAPWTLELEQVEAFRRGDLHLLPDRAKNAWARAYPFALALGTLGLFFSARRRSDPVRWRAASASALLLVSSMLALRAGFYGCVEVATGWRPDIYVQCFAPLLVVVLGLGAALAAGGSRPRRPRTGAADLPRR